MSAYDEVTGNYSVKYGNEEGHCYFPLIFEDYSVGDLRVCTEMYS